MERSITLRFPMIPRLSREDEPLLRRCLGLSAAIITDGSHNRSERWDNIVSVGAAGERLNRARLDIRVPGCSIAWGLRGLGPAICQGEFLPAAGEALCGCTNCCWGALLWVSPVTFFYREKCYTLQFFCYNLKHELEECKRLMQTKDRNFRFLRSNFLCCRFFPSLAQNWHVVYIVHIYVFHVQTPGHLASNTKQQQ